MKPSQSQKVTHFMVIYDSVERTRLMENRSFFLPVISKLFFYERLGENLTIIHKQVFCLIQCFDCGDDYTNV